MQLGMELSCLAYLDESRETIDHEMPMIRSVFGVESTRKSLTELLSRRGYTPDKIFNESEARGYIAHKEGEVVLACRGSTSAKDKPSNLKFCLVPFRPSRHGWQKEQLAETSVRRRSSLGDSCVHRGYYAMLLSLLPVLDQHLLPQFLDAKPKRLVFVGHSRGGSLAILALGYILEMLELTCKTRQHPLLIFAAGAPMCCNAAFRNWLEGRLAALQEGCVNVRVVNNTDFVPRLPGEFLGYVHVGVLCLLTRSGRLWVEPGKNRIKRVKFESVARSFAEHMPYPYYRAIVRAEQATLSSDEAELEAQSDANTGRFRLASFGSWRAFLTVCVVLLLLRLAWPWLCANVSEAVVAMRANL